MHSSKILRVPTLCRSLYKVSNGSYVPYQRVYNSVAFRLGQQEQQGREKTSKFIPYAIAGAVAATFVASQTYNAKEASYKEKLVGKYENRIREMSSPEKIFEYFASVKKGEYTEKEWFMTPKDFVRAITPYNFKAGTEVGLHHSTDSDHIGEPLKRVLSVIDADGDGLISFSEFIFFSTLLAIPPKYFEVAFNLFDEDESETVSAKEFGKIINLLNETNPLAKAQRSTSSLGYDVVCPAFFGANGDEELDFLTFNRFLHELRDAVLQIQFNMVTEGSMMSAKDFAMHLVGYGNLRHIPAYLQRVHELETSQASISFEQFSSFHTVLEYLAEIEFALQSFISLGKPFSKAQLRRAALAVSNIDLSDDLLDVVFFLFDVDGDGQLDYDEFVGILEGCQSFGFSKPRDSGAIRFISCLGTCQEKESYAQ